MMSTPRYQTAAGRIARLLRHSETNTVILDLDGSGWLLPMSPTACKRLAPFLDVIGSRQFAGTDHEAVIDYAVECRRAHPNCWFIAARVPSGSPDAIILSCALPLYDVPSVPHGSAVYDVNKRTWANAVGESTKATRRKERNEPSPKGIPRRH
jgi:hypothetical protein